MPTRDLQDLGDDKEAYRSHLLIRNNRAADDFSTIIQAGKVLSLSGDALDEAVWDVIDVDQWARVFALQSLTGAVDVYTRGGLHHNINFYVRPSDNRVLALPWDWDFAFTGSTSDALIGSAGRAGRLLTRPGYRRFVYGHMLDIINTTFNNDYLDPWITHYGQVAGQNLSPIRSFVSARSRFVLSRLPAEIPFEITTNDGADFSVDHSTVTLNGQGWINVHQIRRAGTTQPLAVRWLDDEDWQLDVSLAGGVHTMTLEAVDHQGQVVGTDTITITSSVPNPVLESLRITEINYNPAAPTASELDQIASLNNDDFEFVELQNIGTCRSICLTSGSIRALSLRSPTPFCRRAKWRSSCRTPRRFSCGTETTCGSSVRSRTAI